MNTKDQIHLRKPSISILAVKNWKISMKITIFSHDWSLDFLIPHHTKVKPLGSYTLYDTLYIGLKLTQLAKKEGL